MTSATAQVPHAWTSVEMASGLASS